MLRAHAYNEHAHKKHKRRSAPSTHQPPPPPRRQHSSQRTRDDPASTSSRSLFSSTWAKMTMSVALHCSIVALLLLASTFFTQSSAQDVGISVDQPNPIAQQHPSVVSGNLNGTTMIIPIPLAMAQQLIPYPILEQSYRSLLPSFPADMYPMMVSAKHDHDLQLPAYNVTVPDFTRAAFEFPFLDLIGDGTPYRLQDTALLTASNQGAITGAEGLGLKIYPAEFDPPSDAYRADGNDGTYFSATASQADKRMTISTKPACSTPYPFDFIVNITNQVVFANVTYCDHYQLLFNTSLTTGQFAPVPVKGTVTGLLEPFTESQTWTGVYGWNYAAAFLEPPMPEACPSRVSS